MIIFFIVLFAAFLIDLIVLMAASLVFLATAIPSVFITVYFIVLIAAISKEGLYSCT